MSQDLPLYVAVAGSGRSLPRQQDEKHNSVNPASSVRGPRYSVSRGATPVLSADQASELLQSIDTANLVGLRDRALLALMTYTLPASAPPSKCGSPITSPTKADTAFSCT